MKKVMSGPLLYLEVLNPDPEMGMGLYGEVVKS